MMLLCCDYAIFLVLSSCLFSMYRCCFDCLYDASFSQFEVYTHHQFLEFLVERIVVQRVFDMEFWLLVLTHVFE